MNKRVVRSVTGLSAVLALVLGLLFIPVSYTIPIGTIVTVSMPYSGNLPEKSILKATGDIEGVANSMINANNGELTLTFAFNSTNGKKSENKVKNALSGVEELPADRTYTSRLITRKVGGNALAAITGGRILINTNGMNDAEIEAAIVSAFQAQGATVGRVMVQTSPDGSERRVEIEFTPDEADGETFYDIQLSDEADQNANVRRVKVIEDCDE